MYYTGYRHVGSTGDVPNCFMIPHGLEGFYSQGTRIETDGSGKELLIFHGDLWNSRPFCPECCSEMHVNNAFATTLRHSALWECADLCAVHKAAVSLSGLREDADAGGRISVCASQGYKGIGAICGGTSCPGIHQQRGIQHHRNRAKSHQGYR